MLASARRATRSPSTRPSCCRSPTVTAMSGAMRKVVLKLHEWKFKDEQLS